MVTVIGQLLPFMVAIALSSVPIMVTVTILLAPGAAPTALSFLIGWLLGMFLITGLLAVGLRSLPRDSSLRSEPAIGIGEIVLGSGLIAYGIFLFARRRRAHPRSELPKWLRAVGSMKPATSLGLAFVLNIRPKALLLSTAAALILGTSHLAIPESIAVLLIFVAVGGSTVGVPVVLALSNPTMMRRPLEATKRWIVRNSRTVAFVVLFIIGAVVLGDGLTRTVTAGSSGLGDAAASASAQAVSTTIQEREAPPWTPQTRGSAS